MTIKFSEDVVSLPDLKTNLGRVVRHAAEKHRPVPLTSRGRRHLGPGQAGERSLAQARPVERARLVHHHLGIQQQTIAGRQLANTALDNRKR